jgi:PAS domain S-box-containing protein
VSSTEPDPALPVKDLLADSEERIRLLIESVTDYAIFLLDPEGYIISWNTGAEHVLGYTSDDIVGQHFSTFYTPEDLARNHPANELKLALANGRYEEEGWRVRKDGSRFVSSVVITPVKDPDGTLRGFAKVTRDVSQKRLLKESEERFRLLVAGVKDYAIFMLDPNGYVVSWNLGAQNIKGYRADEIVGKHFSTFYTQAHKDQNYPQEELRIALKEGRFEDEGWRVKKDGSQFWANVIITPLYGSDGRLSGFAKITRDMSHRRELDLQLADLIRELESFAYSVSHNLRSPLRAVGFNSRILLEEASQNLDEEHQELLRMQYASTVRLAKVVDDMLHLARISRLPLAHAKLDLTLLASETAEEIKAAMPKSSCSIEIEEGLIAHCDKTLIHTVLLNLFENAVKFSPEGGHVRFGFDAEADAFFVSDQGIGFEMEYAEKIFLPFERLVGENEFEGTGIGLATVHRAITRQGGKIWVKSEPGKGTAFYFTLPKAPEA